jgi:hypothetical protein
LEFRKKTSLKSVGELAELAPIFVLLASQELSFADAHVYAFQAAAKIHKFLPRRTKHPDHTHWLHRLGSPATNRGMRKVSKYKIIARADEDDLAKTVKQA